MTKLYEHTTDGGAIYLTTKEHDLRTALVRLDGEPELLKELVNKKLLTAIKEDMDRLMYIFEEVNKAGGFPCDLPSPESLIEELQTRIAEVDKELLKD